MIENKSVRKEVFYVKGKTICIKVICCRLLVDQNVENVNLFMLLNKGQLSVERYTISNNFMLLRYDIKIWK